MWPSGSRKLSKTPSKILWFCWWGTRPTCQAEVSAWLQCRNSWTRGHRQCCICRHQLWLDRTWMKLLPSLLKVLILIASDLQPKKDWTRAEQAEIFSERNSSKLWRLRKPPSCQETRSGPSSHRLKVRKLQRPRNICNQATWFQKEEKMLLRFSYTIFQMVQHNRYQTILSVLSSLVTNITSTHDISTTIKDSRIWKWE